jgi:hypothetical protein
MLISKINTNPLAYQNRNISVAGVVRASYEQPFPFFILEDQTGTLFCQADSELPKPGDHLKIDGTFFVGIPEKCSVPLALLQETHRTSVPHSPSCQIKCCELVAA